MFLEKRDKLIAIGLIAVSVIMNVVLYSKLPDMLVMQKRFDGSPGTTLPTYIGLLILVGVLSFFAYRLYAAESKNEKIKWLLTSILILALNVLTALWNL